MAVPYIAASSIHCFALFLSLLNLHFQMPLANQDSPLFFRNVLQGSSLASGITLYGDAKVVENSSMVQLTKSEASSFGRVIYKDSIRFGKGHGFSTYFTFSVSADGGSSLTLLVAPVGFNANVYENYSRSGEFSVQSGNSQRFLAVEFDVTEASKHVGIDVGKFISLKSRNFSFSEGRLNGGKKLHSWVDYQPSYKKLEVRLSDSGNVKPVGPLISFPIDLNQMWVNETMAVSLSSYNRNSSQYCVLYSWGVKRIINSHAIHSQPYDPNKTLNHANHHIVRSETYCFLRLLAALIFGIACGAAGALMVLYLWTMIGRRRPIVPVAPEECIITPVGFEYKKMKLVDKSLEKGSNV